METLSLLNFKMELKKQERQNKIERLKRKMQNKKEQVIAKMLKHSETITEKSRQKDEIIRLKNHENTVIPASFNYSAVSGLSNEVVQKLTAAKPKNLARASRIQGVTPAAISLLLISLKKHAAQILLAR